MREFILWSNCNNCCKFCWQQKKHDLSTFLNEQEMVTSIETTILELDKINPGDDVLLVGGEILYSYFESVDSILHKLIDKCVNMVREDKIRFLYINTNLIYENRKNLIYLLDMFSGLEDRLKFTTSKDIYGRFGNPIIKPGQYPKAYINFLKNIEFINNNYKKINIVINSIITKQLAHQVKEESQIESDVQIKGNYPVVKYINYIPYIPVPDDRSMDVTFKNIIQVLLAIEKIEPGYINHYIDDFDMNQNKILYEYHKDKGYVECTAQYAKCHHNENFKKVLNNDECYICKLKELFR